MDRGKSLDRRFLMLFVSTTTLIVGALAMGRSAVEGAGILAAVAAVVLGLPGALGLLAMGRLVWLDATKASERTFE